MARLTRHSPQTPSHEPRIWPLVVAGALVLFALHGANLIYKAGWLGGEPNLARQIATASQNRATSSAINLTPLRAVVPPASHNLQFGNPTAGMVLTIFTDPACGPCRAEVDAALAPLDLENLRLVYKIIPQNREDATVGILLLLAAEAGYAEPFWRALHAGSGTYTATDLLQILTKAGLPVPKLQTLLAEKSELYLQQLEEDLTLADSLGFKQPPHFVLNDYILDGRLLVPARLKLYTTRLSTAQPLVQSRDYWLTAP
ncbi:MAG: hypothetical protein COY40_06185 [Alphaproteobacteria bacterium CG_4_10_14_0_8_um_filter_53_9]|nr:MAG: hypothetical protein COY40_06185 [Alphaproteobacteria bacterium CG_4_10_14_0_8_um_filter_53_9]